MAARRESAKEISIYGLNRTDVEKEIFDPDVPADEGKQGPKLKRACAKATAKAKGKSKQSSAPIPEQAKDSEGAPNEESPVSEEHASDSGREKELEAAGPKESASSDALLFQGYDITGSWTSLTSL